MSTRLIVNGDDFGMSRGISDAIILAHRYGILTSASLMVNMPAAEYALSRLARTPHLAVGIHLNICAGRPILPREKVCSLIDSAGNFLRASEMICRLWLARVSAAEIEAEFCAQIQWMVDRGIAPVHADSHHHMHIYPAAAGPFRRALVRHGIECARACKLTVWPSRPLPGAAHAGSFPRRLCVEGYRSLLQRVIFRDLRCADSRLAVCSDGQANISRFARWVTTLSNLPEGAFEWVCHPGLFERGFSETDRISSQREMELEWLTSSEIRDIVARQGIRLITYRDLDPTSACGTSSAQEPALF